MTTTQKKRLRAPIQKYNDLSEDQAIAKKVIDSNDITCLLGQAGSGKTHLAVTYALERLALERKLGGINKIIITRPTIASKEDNIGFMPGSEEEKMAGWLYPQTSILEDIEGVEKSKALLKDKKVEILALMFCQGRTFKNSIVIVDESQNLSRNGAERLFTRLGTGSKMIFTGDPRQSLIDVRETGLDRLMQLSGKVEGLESYTLTSNFRNPIIEKLLEVY